MSKQNAAEVLLLTAGRYCELFFFPPACSFGDAIYSRVGVRGAAVAMDGFGDADLRREDFVRICAQNARALSDLHFR